MQFFGAKYIFFENVFQTCWDTLYTSLYWKTHLFSCIKTTQFFLWSWVETRKLRAIWLLLMWLKPRVYKLLWSPKSSWLSFLAFQNHSLGKTQVEGRGSSLMGWKSHLDYNMPSGKRRSAFQKSFLKNPLRHSWAKNNNKTRLKNFSGMV